MIFGNYDMRRDHLLSAIMNEQVMVQGFWRDTLFPAIKDLIRYGADRFEVANENDQIVQSAVDTAAATLGLLVPELLPFMSSISNFVRPTAATKTREMIDAVKNWTIKGPHYPEVAIYRGRLASN